MDKVPVRSASPMALLKWCTIIMGFLTVSFVIAFLIQSRYLGENVQVAPPTDLVIPRTQTSYPPVSGS